MPRPPNRSTTDDQSYPNRRRNRNRHTPPVPLYEIHIAQVAVMADAWALDTYPHPAMPAHNLRHLAFASLIGAATTIKGIRAALHVGKDLHGAVLQPYRPGDPGTRTWQNVNLSYLHNARLWQKRIPTLTHSHHLIAAAGDLPQPQPEEGTEQERNGNSGHFYIFARNEADGPMVFYREFSRRSPTPTIPEWAPQIWDLATAARDIRPLTAWRIFGWRCDIDYPVTEQRITDLVQKGDLPIPAP